MNLNEQHLKETVNLFVIRHSDQLIDYVNMLRGLIQNIVEPLEERISLLENEILELKGQND